LSVKVPCARPYENAHDLMDSLRRVIDLKPKFAFCYHKGVLSDPENALKAKLAFMEGLREKILPLSEKGMDAATIARKVLGQDPWLMHAISRGDFSCAHLVRSFLRPPGEGYELPNIALHWQAARAFLRLTLGFGFWHQRRQNALNDGIRRRGASGHCNVNRNHVGHAP